MVASSNPVLRTLNHRHGRQQDGSSVFPRHHARLHLRWMEVLEVVCDAGQLAGVSRRGSEASDWGRSSDHQRKRFACPCPAATRPTATRSAGPGSARSGSASSESARSGILAKRRLEASFIDDDGDDCGRCCVRKLAANYSTTCSDDSKLVTRPQSRDSVLLRLSA